MKKNYDACIFDLDGTLVDSLADLADCCNESLKLFELPEHTLDEYRRFVGCGIRNMVCSAMGERSEDEKLMRSVYDTFTMIYEEKCLDKTRPYPDIVALLQTLKENGVKTGVLSNKADDFAKRIVTVLFKSSLLDVVYGHKREFPIKPSPDSLLAMMDELGASANKCLYIGDSNVDVNTANNACVDFCGVEWGFRGYDELARCGAKTIVSCPSQIAELVLCSDE